MNNTSPALLFYAGNYDDSRAVPLENIFPLQFSFGIGVSADKRPNQVSKIEPMNHHLMLSLSQFQRHEFVLVIMGMYQREKTFQGGSGELARVVKGSGEEGEEKGFNACSLVKFGRDDEFFVIAIVAIAITIDICLFCCYCCWRLFRSTCFQFVNLSRTTK